MNCPDPIQITDHQRTPRGPTPTKSVGTTIADLLQMSGVPVGSSDIAARMPVTFRKVRAGESLVHEGAPDRKSVV